MAEPTIVQIVRTYFTSDFYKKAADILHERKYEIEKAQSAIIPLVLGAMLNKATKNVESCEAIFNDCRDAERVFSVNYDYELLTTEKMVNEGHLFIKEQPNVEKEISDYSGIRPASVSGLISLSIPSILGLLGKHIMRNKLSPSGLAGYLSSQENDISNSIPVQLVSLEKYLNISPPVKVNKLHWDYSFKKFTSVRSKRWWRVLIITIIVIIATGFYFLAKNQ
ncbi:MAG: DUF937 domain-containing protein [Ginsengibacter sp.]